MPARRRFRLSKPDVLTTIVPRCFNLDKFFFNAAAFITTNTSQRSPGVKTSVEPKLIWKPDTPASVPKGALISAGKSGNVLKSLPCSAVLFVNWVPVN